MQKTPIRYQQNACQLFQGFAYKPYALLLDSGNPSEQQGRFDIFSAWPSKTLSINTKHATFNNANKTQTLSLKDAWALLENSKQQTKDEHAPFQSGWMGMASYELGYKLSPTTGQGQSPMLPGFWAGFYEWAVVQDHKLKQSFLFTPENFCPKQKQQILKLLEAQNPQNQFALQQGFSNNMSFSHYQKQFTKIQNYLKQGDCYQVNFAQRFSANYKGDGFVAYQKLRQQVPSPYMAFINLGDKKILSISPECFLKACDNKIQSWPIKGTAARSNNIAADKKAAQDLLASSKNRAENLMIVDLIRNDLGQFAKAGSVKVPKLFELQSYNNVHHLVSTVSATLKPKHSIWQAFLGSFPGGSITGAPKIRASQIINELEPCNREIYCGSVFYASSCGQFDSNIAIRTLLLDEQTETAYAWAGGGIVVDSTCEDEYQECFNKIERLLKALEH